MFFAKVVENQYLDFARVGEIKVSSFLAVVSERNPLLVKYQQKGISVHSSPGANLIQGL